MKKVTDKDLNQAVRKIETKNNIKSPHSVIGSKFTTQYLQRDGSLSAEKTNSCYGSESLDEIGNYRFTLKINRYHQLYHPDNIFYYEASERRARQDGTEVYSFTNVSKEAFAMYAKFLKTNNPLYLAQAQKLL